MARAIESGQHVAEVCGCGWTDCLHVALDYPWCRPCGEHHRLPECAVDSEGRSLALCGHPWEQVDDDPDHWKLHEE